MKTRIEVDDQGRYYVIIPDDIIAEIEIDEGDPVQIDHDDVFIYVDYSS